MFVGKYQWQIMRSLGLQDDEIKNFADVNYWLQYFPPKTEADLRVSYLCNPSNPSSPNLLSNIHPLS